MIKGGGRRRDWTGRERERGNEGEGGEGRKGKRKAEGVRVGEVEKRVLES